MVTSEERRMNGRRSRQVPKKEKNRDTRGRFVERRALEPRPRCYSLRLTVLYRAKRISDKERSTRIRNEANREMKRKRWKRWYTMTTRGRKKLGNESEPFGKVEKGRERQGNERRKTALDKRGIVLAFVRTT